MPSMPGSIQSEFGRQVRLRREAAGLTQETLAERSGSHVNYVGGVERGERNPTLTKINALAEALNCRVGDLCDSELSAADGATAKSPLAADGGASCG